MNRLITASLLKSDLAKLVEFPKEIMDSSEAKIVKFVLEYSSKYGEVPTVDRVAEEFDYFIPFAFPATVLPLGDIYDLTVKAKLNDYVVAQLNEAKDLIYENGEVDTDPIQRIMRAVGLTSGLSKYSTFDRETYFRLDRTSWGLKTIDKVTGGIANGDYGLIVGRLGTGKTTLTLWIANHWRNMGKLVLLVSNEMLAADVFSRIDGMEGTFNPLRLRTDADDEIKTILKTVARRAKASEGKGDIIIPNKRLGSPEQIFALARDLNVDVVIVDGVYLMSMATGGFSAKWERISEISNALKQGAIDIQRPVMGVTQLKRLGGDKETLDAEDLAYSDSLGQDADFILGIRPLIEMAGHRIEAQLIKNRFGPRTACQISIDYSMMIVHEDSVYGEYEYDKDSLGITVESLAAKEWEMSIERSKVIVMEEDDDEEELLSPETIAKLVRADEILDDDEYIVEDDDEIEEGESLGIFG